MSEIINDDKEYDIILPPDVKLHRVYDYLPYTHWRIKQILDEDCNVGIQLVRGYKEGRYPGYKQHYRLYDKATGNIIKDFIRLDDLRRFFAARDYPLHKDNSRNRGAAHFLEIVNAIAASQKKDL